jgi:hypothetical protein
MRILAIIRIIRAIGIIRIKRIMVPIKIFGWKMIIEEIVNLMYFS